MALDVDIVTLVLAFGSMLLSAYTWWQMRKSANIEPNEIINYGLINSSQQEAIALCIPLIFHNDSANSGIITKIRIGFSYGGETKYLDNLEKIKLIELSGRDAYAMNWDKFEEEGYGEYLELFSNQE